MFQKILITLSMSTVLLMALAQDEMVPQKVIEKLELKNDKVYIIDFFASWCKSCKKELPLMVNLQNQIDQNSTELIGVDVDESLEDAQSFQESLALNFKVVNDTNNELIGLFDPVGMPSVFIVKELKIVAVLTGARENIDRVILDGLKDLK
jgi:thiol-disulfide isomerase/thioredoxin